MRPGPQLVAVGDDANVPSAPTGWSQPDQRQPPHCVQRCHSRLSPPRTNRSIRPSAHDTAAGSPTSPLDGAPNEAQPREGVAHQIPPSVPVTKATCPIDGK